MVTLRGKHSERGAILIHAAVGMVALVAFSALVVDYGVLWASRHQAQNAADAAAHSAAEQLTFGDPTDKAAARNAALAVASQNKIWGQAPDITAADITFPPCPPGAPGAPDTCVRADVFRNQRAGGSPLPMFFGQIVGLQQQGVRATATAQMFIGAFTDCVKPFAIPDKWTEINPIVKTWAPTDEYNAYKKVGNTWVPIANPDVYTAPSTDPNGNPGTAFSIPTDYGVQLTFKNGNPHDTISPGWYYPVRLSPGDSGANDYRWNISHCNTEAIGPGTVLDLETGNMVGPTNMGMTDLYNLDPSAYWDPTAASPYSGHPGAPSGGCVAAGTCTISPRLVAVAFFDPALYAQSKSNGGSTVTVTHVLGFWINGINNQGDVSGYITFYPALAKGGTHTSSSASFLRTVILVR